MKKSLLVGISSTAITIGVIGLAGLASAQTTSTSGTNLVDKIATKFSLNKTDVQAVFDADRTEHEAKLAAEVKTTLDAAVKAGTITQAQADQLIVKQKEMRTFMDSLKDKTKEERHSAMKTKMDEFRQWLTDNKIPDGVLNTIHGGGFGGRGRHGGPRPGSDTPTTDTMTH